MDKISRVSDLVGIIIGNKPESADVILSEDNRIKDKKAIQKLLEKATNPEVDKLYSEVKHNEEFTRYESVLIDSKDIPKEELRHAAKILWELPSYDADDRYPSGTYIMHKDTVVCVQVGVDE